MVTVNVEFCIYIINYIEYSAILYSTLLINTPLQLAQQAQSTQLHTAIGLISVTLGVRSAGMCLAEAATKVRILATLTQNAARYLSLCTSVQYNLCTVLYKYLILK